MKTFAVPIALSILAAAAGSSAPLIAPPADSPLLLSQRDAQGVPAERPVEREREVRPAEEREAPRERPEELRRERRPEETEEAGERRRPPIRRDDERPHGDRERAEARRLPARDDARRVGPERRPTPPVGEIREQQRRLHHLMAAAHNLHAASLHELAERVQKEAEGLQRRLQEAERAGPRPPAGLNAPVEREPGFGRGGVPGRIAELEEQVRALRSAVEELRRQHPGEI